MANTLIVPGLGGSGPGHWQRWWLRTDPDALLVEQDDWRRPSSAAWTERLVEAITAHPYSWIVAHGLGATLVARLAADRLDLAIAGALLVAPTDLGHGSGAADGLRTFAPVSLAPLPFPAAVIASRSDSCMRFARARALAAAWGAELVDYGDAGRIDPVAGFGPWPDGPAQLSGVKARRRLRRADTVVHLNSPAPARLPLARAARALR